MLLAADLGYLQRPAAAVASMKSKLLKHLMPFYRNFHDGLSDLRRAQISILTWLSKSPAKRTKRTSKTQDLSRVTWSSWCKHLNPGINLAKVHTWRTWSMNRSLNWSINESSGRPFIGHVWKFGKKIFENSCQLKSLSAYQWASLLCVHHPLWPWESKGSRNKRSLLSLFGGFATAFKRLLSQCVGFREVLLLQGRSSLLPSTASQSIKKALRAIYTKVTFGFLFSSP